MADPLNVYSWFHGSIARIECESVLNQKERPGLFLVRNSSSSAGDYVLSVREVGKVSHYIINFKRNSGVYKIGDQTFDDLPSIVEFYKKHFLDTTTLVEPAPRPGFQQTPGGGFQQPPGGGGGGPPLQSNDSVKVRAKFNFVGSDPEDLSFKKGDILTILKKEEDDWWLARHGSGKEGLIPRPYVEEMPAGTAPPQITRPTSIPQQRIINPAPPARPMMDRNSGPSYQEPTGTPSALPPGPVMARAIQARDPSFYDPSELKFKKDDRILVHQRNENGIWEGENLENGNRGLFPFRLVQILQDQS